jgi:hypothetical protein
VINLCPVLLSEQWEANLNNKKTSITQGINILITDKGEKKETS